VPRIAYDQAAAVTGVLEERPLERLDVDPPVDRRTVLALA